MEKLETSEIHLRETFPEERYMSVSHAMWVDMQEESTRIGLPIGDAIEQFVLRCELFYGVPISMEIVIQPPPNDLYPQGL